MGEFTAYSAQTYTVDGYSRLPTQDEIIAVRAYDRTDLELGVFEYWRPRHQSLALQETKPAEVITVPLPDPLEQHFLEEDGYDGKQLLIELKERYRMVAPFGNYSYGAERVTRKLGEMVASAPVDAWQLRPQSPVMQYHIQVLASEGWRNVAHAPELAVEAAIEVAMFAKAVRPESILLLKQALAVVDADETIPKERRMDIREKVYAQFAIYSMGRVEPFPVGEKWRYAKGSRSVLLYTYDSAVLSNAAKEALSFDELLSF